MWTLMLSAITSIVTLLGANQEIRPDWLYLANAFSLPSGSAAIHWQDYCRNSSK